MSISRYVDGWFEETGGLPIAEVEPDHACQEFLPSDGVILVPSYPDSGKSHSSLGETINMVRDLLA
ncbi:hypothetical protein [Corynebacterium occultum]|uniref:hypothetical protein n=1 Tax=Corynebacterium occultum TaxID=2675219 RepID=UPI0012E26E0A|nr:hypothetical protein [Corynebacterium occultum]